MNKIEKIVNELLTHEISKQEAVKALEALVDEKIPYCAVEYTVDSVASNIESDHILKIVHRFSNPEKMRDVSKGDKVLIITKY